MMEGGCTDNEKQTLAVLIKRHITGTTKAGMKLCLLFGLN